MRFRNDLDRVLQEEFKEEYFSGCDVRIFFENIPIPEFTGISYRIFQNYRPEYGYASFKPDAISFGTRLLQGQFTTNFQHTEYMDHILQAINDDLVGSVETTVPESRNPDIETLVGGEFNYDNFVDSLSQDQQNWEQLLEAYKTFFLGGVGPKTRERSLRTRSFQRLTPKYLGADSIEKSRILGEGFSIYIIYKATDLWYNGVIREGKQIAIDEKLSLWKTQHPTQLDTPGMVRVLSGVRITAGGDQDIDVSGTPLQETWSFIATDVGTLSG